MKKTFNLTVLAFVGPFVANFFVVLFALLIQFLWTYIDDMIGKGLEWYIILKLLFFISASFVPMALPLAVLLSSIMAFGSLAESYELVALKSAGVSLVRIMVPLISLICLIVVGEFFFANDVIPVANLKSQSLLWDVRQQRPALDIKEKVFYNGIEDYRIYIGKKDKNSQKIEDVKIYDHTHHQGNDVVLTAKSGEMTVSPDQRWLVIDLSDGERDEEMRDNDNGPHLSDPASQLIFKTYELKFDLSKFNLHRTDETLFKENSVMLNINQLQYYIDSLKVSLKRKTEIGAGFSRNYLTANRDSMFLKKNQTAGHILKTVSDKKPFAYAIPTADPKHLIVRAESTARTLRDIYKSQAEDIENTEKDMRNYEIEWHRKFSLSLACLTLFFIGAPLGAIIRKGGIGYPTVAAIIMFLIYYVISIIGERAARVGAINMVFGMWISTIVLLPIGLYLTYRANRDSIRFNFINIVRWVSSLIPKKGKPKETVPTE